MQIGRNAGASSFYLTSSPDGVVAAPRGTLVADTSTGVTWKNRTGSTIWDPIDIPIERGFMWKLDHIGNASQPTQNLTAGGTSSINDPSTSQAGIRSQIVAATGDAVVHRDDITSITTGDGAICFRASLRLSALSDGTNNMVVRVGMGDSANASDHTDGIYLEYDFATHGDHNWRICTMSNGSPTKTTTGIPPVANTYQALEIFVNAAGTSVGARVGGTLAPTPVTATIPGAGRSMSSLNIQTVKQAGAGSLNTRWDAAAFWKVFTTARTL